jgi:cytochrome P450
MAATSALPPGPRWPTPLTTLGWMARPFPFVERCRDRYGDTFTLRIAREAPWVFVSHPDAVKQVFTGDPRLLHAGEANGILRPILGHHSVLLLDDDRHMAQRKLMLPAFHGERMQRYGDVMTAIAEREIASWPRGGDLELAPRMQALTLEVILRAIFGVDEGERLDRLRAALRTAMEFATDPKTVAGLILRGYERAERHPRLRAALDPVDALLADEIHRRREAPDLGERDDILSLLVQARHEDGSPMTDTELRDELMTLLVAGHETTATGLAWALERLVRHPAALERLREEVLAGDEEYLDAVVKETLRLRPVLAIVLRKLMAPMEIAGHRLPAGVNVVPCIYLMHRREDIYPDPRAFRPERFLERPAGTYTWIPFGGGVRRCLGASFALFEMKTVLAAVVRGAGLRPADPAPERTRRRAITHAPARGAHVTVGAPAQAPAAPQAPVSQPA